MMATPLFMPLFWVAVIGNLVLFFVAQNVAMKGNNATALPLLSIYSLITGFTLSGLVAFAGAVAGIGAVGTAALATGITFVIASIVGRRMSDSVGQALSGVVGLGLIGLILAMVVQFVGGIFAPAMFHGTSFELMIAGFGTVLFVGAAFVDFYTMPRSYRDDQYLAGALSMYLTYINLFIFILASNHRAQWRWPSRLIPERHRLRSEASSSPRFFPGLFCAHSIPLQNLSDQLTDKRSSPALHCDAVGSS